MSSCSLALVLLGISVLFGIFAEHRAIQKHDAIGHFGGLRWWQGFHPVGALFYLYRHFLFRDFVMSLAIVLNQIRIVGSLYVYEIHCG